MHGRARNVATSLQTVQVHLIGIIGTVTQKRGRKHFKICGVEHLDRVEVISSICLGRA